jgi:hypothetical protein
MISRLLTASALCCGALFSSHASAMQPLDFGAIRISADTRYMGDWISGTGDAQGLPFVIVDKRYARIYVFDPVGRMVGAAPVLLGLAPGDHSVPDIGQRELSQILPSERTTPAGRFVSVPGRNLTGEQVIWVDYNAGLAIHRVRGGQAAERRTQKLGSGNLNDHRVSLGCIVVAPEFYENVVQATLGKSHAVIYVLPELRPASELFSSQ